MENIQKQKVGFKFGKYRLKVLEEYGEVAHNGRKYKLIKVRTNNSEDYISLRLYNKNNKFIKQFLMEPEIIEDIVNLFRVYQVNKGIVKEDLRDEVDQEMEG